MESEGKPKNEAHALFKLLRHGHTVEQLRAEIGCSTDYRRKVLLHFDALLFRRLPAERKAKFEAKITALLAQGWSHRAVRAMLPVTVSFIRTVSRQSGACTRHPRMGRRFTPEQKENIFAAVRQGKRPMQIARELQISVACAMKYRRALGHFDRRIYQPTFSEQQIAEAVAAVKHGEAWRAAAKQFRIGTSTLLLRSEYRKRVSAARYRPDRRCEQKRHAGVHPAFHSRE